MSRWSPSGIACSIGWSRCCSGAGASSAAGTAWCGGCGARTRALPSARGLPAPPLAPLETRQPAAAVAGDLSPLVAGDRKCVHSRKDSQIAELTVTPQERPDEMRGVGHVAHDVAPLVNVRCRAVAAETVGVVDRVVAGRRVATRAQYTEILDRPIRPQEGVAIEIALVPVRARGRADHLATVVHRGRRGALVPGIQSRQALCDAALA